MPQFRLMMTFGSRRNRTCLVRNRFIVLGESTVEKQRREPGCDSLVPEHALCNGQPVLDLFDGIGDAYILATF